MLFFNRVLKWSDNLPRTGKAITKSFFSAVNVTSFSVSLLLRKLLMQLSVILIGNAFFFNISSKWHASKWNFEKSETIENVRKKKVKIKPTLYFSEIKLLKFEYNNILIIHSGTTGLSIFTCFMWYFILRKMIMIKVISLVLLFMILNSFLADKFIAYILRSRYGDTLVKEVRRLEKIHYKLRKCIDIVFWEIYLENKIRQKFLKLCVSNLHLKTLRAFHSCQMKLLRKDVFVKKSKVKAFGKDFIVLTRKLRETLGITDSIHICCLFLN